MTGDSFDEIFAGIRAFEWDENKRERNWRIHKIDFDTVRAIFDDNVLIRRSDRNDETRFQVFGYIDGREVTLICTIREDRCRIISARRARKDERRKYYSRLPGRSEKGQD